ncbi:MAG: tryptophanase [Parcubacteria group bacterium]|nr:tryptophanase [Parcubacteria group bacterium]
MAEEFSLTDFTTKHHPRPHVNALVRPHHVFSTEERRAAAFEAGWNVFQFPSEMLLGGDLLSDSGTTALTVEQEAAMRMGDEAYGSNWGYFQLLKSLEDTFDISERDWAVYLFHQGRAAEHALYSHIRKKNGYWLCVPSNGFFDTTRANAEANHIEAADRLDASDPIFRGNIDVQKLERDLRCQAGIIPFVLMTVTNNTAGGQPVSLANIESVRDIAHAWDVPLLLDACRFAENAWFIKKHEPAYAKKTIAEIVHAMVACCDGFTISFKKDGLSNMGGALILRKKSLLTKRYPDLLEQIYDHQILVEGHHTYGGIPGRDIMTIAQGLRYAVQEEYLGGRIGLVHDFGTYLSGLGVPTLTPIGGHAVYIDIDKFFADTNMVREDFGGISLTALLLLKGVRLCELGAFAFGKYDLASDRDSFPAQNYVRAAVPRNKYERDDLYYVADCIKALYDRRHDLPKAVPTYGRDKTLRHFKARFSLEYR